MSEAVYKWRDGAWNTRGLDPQEVGEHLEILRVQHNGRLTPVMVIDSARDETSFLHGYFQWDDAIAGHKYREEQARNLIRSISVKVEQKPDSPVRAFVSVTRDKDKSYTSIAHAMTDAELRAQVLSQAWRELQAWQKRYKEFEELANIVTAIESERERLALAE